jgi:nitroreductase
MIDIDIEKNKILDEIINSRRTIREFTQEIPKKELINDILKAGLQAPFAAIAVKDEKYFRRFFVIKNDQSMDKIAKIIQNRVKIILDNLSGQIEILTKAEEFVNILKDISNNGFNFRSPYTVVVAEKEGFPPIAQLSLAYCLENMWLKTTALGLGFRLMSIVSELSRDEEFCKFLGVKPGEFALNACAIGYVKTIPPKVERPSLEEITKWF